MDETKITDWIGARKVWKATAEAMATGIRFSIIDTNSEVA